MYSLEYLGVWSRKKVVTVDTRIMARPQSLLCWFALRCLLSSTAGARLDTEWVLPSVLGPDLSAL